MNNVKLSIVIPSYKDPLLHKTLDSLLENSELGEGELEIVVVLDGYWPVQQIKNDSRIKIIHLGANLGMRGAINSGIAIAKGEFIGRLDEHCKFGKGYDRILVRDCESNSIISPRRYFLDPKKWEIMEEHGYVDYERLVIQNVGKNVRKFAGQRWRSRTKERANIMVDENQAVQGSFWVMPRALFNEVVGELNTEKFGPTYQDSVEVCMAVWKNGGKLLKTKNTWFAHKHRSFSRTHQEGSPENPSNREASWTAALKEYEDYYRTVLLPRWNEEVITELKIKEPKVVEKSVQEIVKPEVKRKTTMKNLSANVHIGGGSHLPILMKILNMAEGPILELGTGLFSTPFLHWACYDKKRELVSYENKIKFADFWIYDDKREVGNDYSYHDVRFVDNNDWDAIDIENRHWSVVFIDHNPGPRRKEEMKRVANHADYVVVHDTDDKNDWYYKYSEYFPLFKYRHDTGIYPRTTVLSNFKDLSNL